MVVTREVDEFKRTRQECAEGRRSSAQWQGRAFHGICRIVTALVRARSWHSSTSGTYCVFPMAMLRFTSRESAASDRVQDGEIMAWNCCGEVGVGEDCLEIAGCTERRHRPKAATACRLHIEAR